MERPVSPDELSVVLWDTEDGHQMVDLQNNSCDQTGRLTHAGSCLPVNEQHPEYVEGFSYVPDVDLRGCSYNIFNRYGMLRRPYAGTQGVDEDRMQGLVCGASLLSSTAEKVVKRPRWRPCDLELCLLSTRRKEEGVLCTYATVPDAGSDSTLDIIIECLCFSNISKYSKSLFNRGGMLHIGGDKNRKRIPGVPSDLEICLRARADKEDREEYRSDAGVTRRSDQEMRRRGITR
jgi:hypothetical protein